MNTNFLLDRTFLLKVNRHHTKEYWAGLMVLDFQTERPIQRIETKVVSGNMNIVADSPVRKTCTLQLVFDKDTFNITDVNSLIAINKKIALSVGITNPFYHTEEYHDYGDTLWFKQGTFLITRASSQISPTGSLITCEMIDKMGMLNGVCGGTLPASTSFHDRIIIDKDDNITTEYPLISEIVRETVHHFGGEDYSRIIVDDIPDVGRTVVRYVGSSPINFATDDSQTPPIRLPGASFIIGDPPIANYMDSYYQGEDVGYMEVALTYPGELIMAAGAFVTNVLDEIVKTLGNFEYFYDNEGNFHFQQIRNYDKTGRTPLNLGPDEDAYLQALYLPKFNDDQYINELIDTELVMSLSQNPNYANIKNDFICWGTRENSDSDNSMVRYHLTIDKRPEEVRPADVSGSNAQEYSLCFKDIWEVRDATEGNTIRYQVRTQAINAEEVWGQQVAPPLDVVFENLDEVYQFNWREELYRQALLAYGSSTRGSYYDEELLAEWRGLYDPTSTFDAVGSAAFQKTWEDYYGTGNQYSPWSGYNIDVSIAPEKIRYWMDIIDADSPIGAYSINRVGRRTSVLDNSKINEVFETEINDIVFIENTGDADEMQEKAQYYIGIGQSYCFLSPEQMPYFEYKNSFGTCFESVRQMMYSYLIYNTTISIGCLPIFYMDVNKIIRLNYSDLGIDGDFIINQISWGIGTATQMNISAHEAIVII